MLRYRIVYAGSGVYINQDLYIIDLYIINQSESC